MDNRTTRNILIILGIIILLAIIGYFLFFFKFPGTAVPAPAPVKTGQSNLPPASPAAPVVKQAQVPAAPTATPPSADEVLKYTLVKEAASFAERLGSYSNQGNYENINNLKIMMTASMQKWADNYVAAAKKSGASTAVYQGVTTHAINSEIKNFDSAKGAAEILIHTQRVNLGGAASSSPAYNQDISISFLKEGSQWKVDNAKWIK